MVKNTFRQTQSFSASISGLIYAIWDGCEIEPISGYPDIPRRVFRSIRSKACVNQSQRFRGMVHCKVHFQMMPKPANKF